MNKATQTFIDNAGKSNQKPIVFIDALKPSKALDIAAKTVWIALSLVGFIIFAMAVYNGY